MSEGQFVVCPLCGFPFIPQKGGCFSSCPWGKNCQLFCCPQCHYRFPAESKLVSFIKKVLKMTKGREKKTNEGKFAKF